MAEFKSRPKPKPIEIDKWLGINESVGQTEAKPGEWISGFNYRTTKEYNIDKRPGHHTFINFPNTQNVQGVWQGVIGGKEILLTCWNGNVYEYDLTVSTTTIDIADLITEGTVTIIGTLTDAKTWIFWFQDKIYFMNGTDYKEYDGTTYQDVPPYVPTIAINAPPTGGGTLFEEVNLLTGQKTQTFIGDGTSLYQLAETNIDSDTVLATINGVTVTEGIDFTVNRTLGQVTFSTTPALNDLVSITWVKVVAGNKELVTNSKYAIDFGIENDTNLFIWGNPNEKYTFRFSGVAKANYFPANSFVNVGSTEFAITDLKPNQQNLLVFKEKRTFIVKPTVNPNFASNSGLNPYNFGYQDLNEQVGNIAPQAVQIIEDSPVSLDRFSMWLWGITNVELQRNAKIISERLKLSLQVINLANAVTFNYQNQKEYWVNVDDIVYIWNYGNNTMYKYSNIRSTQFIEYNEQIIYGSNGTVELIDESFLADGEVLGDSIPCRIYSGFLDFGALLYRKMMRDEWLSIASGDRTSVKIKFTTDRVNEDDAIWKEIEYSLINFDDIDFDDFTFETNRNPQPNRFRYKVKKFTYLQYIIDNDTNDAGCTVLKLLMPVQTTGYSR